ncbi:hypothetical protein OBBRIDRAFT_219102 [Obba rivulosa]|uniref:Uncharacterized protein n=1 Tax=Obba rivulosa TaxID=1052685 RepID=A0A8E2DI77_9APHY|nr:hypothetical protein OBBRIDRAFT_219102 [Obba rivulosa]
MPHTHQTFVGLLHNGRIRRISVLLLSALAPFASLLGASSALLSAKGYNSRQKALKGSRSTPSQINIFLMLGLRH